MKIMAGVTAILWIISTEARKWRESEVEKVERDRRWAVEREERVAERKWGLEREEMVVEGVAHREERVAERETEREAERKRRGRKWEVAMIHPGSY